MPIVVTEEETKAFAAKHRQVAVHEAGHVVCARATGLSVQRVIGKQTGSTTVDVPPTLQEAQRVAAKVAYFAGGPAAEKLVLGAANDEHGLRDAARIQESKEQNPELSAYLEAAERRATCLIARYRSVVERLAERLQSLPPTVQGAELDRLIEGIGPEPPALPADGTVIPDCEE